MLPSDFPPWQTVYGYFRPWRDNGTWQRIHRYLRALGTAPVQAPQSPSVAIADTQSCRWAVSVKEVVTSAHALCNT